MYTLVCEGKTVAESPSFRVLIAAARELGKPCEIPGVLEIAAVPAKAPKAMRKKKIVHTLETKNDRWARYDFEITDANFLMSAGPKFVA